MNARKPLVSSSLLALVAIASASAATAAPQGGPSCSTGIGCQMSDGAGWALSDDNPNGGLLAADNMRITADGSISSLCWWGVYFDFNTFSGCGPGSGDDFTVTYYADDDCRGIPGSVRAGPLPITLTSAFATGGVVSGGGITLDEYQYEGTHPQVPVSAGECLWIQIQNNTDQNCFWFWSTANAADGLSAQGGVFGFTPVPIDLAFCVDVATTSNGCNDPVATTYCTPKINSAGCAPAIAAAYSGFALKVTADQVLPGELGLLFYSTSGPASAPFQGSFLCVQSPITRTAVQTAGNAGAPPCSGTYSFDFSAYVNSGIDPTLSGGQMVWAQYWSRDAGDPFGTGLTNAVTFSVCP